MKHFDEPCHIGRRVTFLRRADPCDMPFFGGGNGTGSKFKIWEDSFPFDLSKTVSFRGILFARPESKLSNTQIIPTLPYFDLDSGQVFNFWCVGYRISDVSSRPVAVIKGKKWEFDLERFVEVKQDFEKHTRWQYGGGADLILCNEILDINKGGSWLELKSAVCVSIDELLSKQYIKNFETFFQQVINFAKSYEGSRPSWKFSDKQGLRLIGKGLKESIVHLLPKPFRKAASEAEYFAVRDIGK